MSHRIAGLVAAAAISHLGTGMTMLAIPWFVLHSTGRGTDVGLVVMAETGGVLAGSAFGGPWVDLLRPRRAAVVFDVVAAGVVLAIPLLHSGVPLPLWSLVALAGVLGLSRAPGDAARQVLGAGHRGPRPYAGRTGYDRLRRAGAGGACAPTPLTRRIHSMNNSHYFFSIE